MPAKPHPIDVRLDECQMAYFAKLIAKSFQEVIDPMSQALDDLAAEVKANTDVVQSAVELINGMADQIAAAGTDPAALAALTAELKASAQALADSVAAHTVADPAPAPAPDPMPDPAPVDPAADPNAP